MRDLRYYFTNPFDSPEISLNELSAFTTDFLGRISGQNEASGRWTARIAAVMPKMTALDDAITDDLTKGGFRAARKQAKNDFKRSLPTQAGSPPRVSR